MRYVKTSNARTLHISERTKITVWLGGRAAGWRRELIKFGTGWTGVLSWGNPTEHKPYAFLVNVTHIHRRPEQESTHTRGRA